MTKKKSEKGEKPNPIKKSGGSPPHIPDDDTREKVRTLWSMGATCEVICEYLQINKSTLYKYYMEDLREAKVGAVSRVAKALFRRAIGYDTIETHRTIDSDGKTITKTISKHVAADPACIFFFLVNRAPDQWQSVNKVELTGANGSAIQITPAVDLKKLSEVELEEYRRMVEKATLKFESGNENVIDVEAVDK